MTSSGSNGGGDARAGDPHPKGARGAEAPPAEKLEIGFATRLRFLSMAELEAARAARYGLSLSLALFGLEDREALREVLDQDLERCDWEIGNRLAGGIRQGPDVLARFALGEWALLLPHTGLDGAVAVAQRCLERVCGQDLRTSGTSLRITVSAGVAAHQPVRRYGVETVGQLVQAAERAQRQSSALGGGRAVGVACGSAVAADRGATG
jgi:PleD family two-component response regulator